MMAENLQYDGDTMFTWTTAMQFADSTCLKKRCVDCDEAEESQGICPDGWKVPGRGTFEWNANNIFVHYCMMSDWHEHHLFEDYGGTATAGKAWQTAEMPNNGNSNRTGLSLNPLLVADGEYGWDEYAHSGFWLSTDDNCTNWTCYTHVGDEEEKGVVFTIQLEPKVFDVADSQFGVMTNGSNSAILKKYLFPVRCISTLDYTETEN